MASVVPFRRLRRGPPRRLPTPHFLRESRSRLAWIRRHFGFLALAAMIGAGVFLFGPWHDGTPRPLAGGYVRVIDGDTLLAQGERIRLIGIDAPELSQTCRDAQNHEWSCGRAAKARLAALVSRGEVVCSARGHDRYGRTLAVCSAGDIADLGAALVREGQAVDYGGYLSAETAARLAGRGLWGGDFERPRDWRRAQLHKG